MNIGNGNIQDHYIIIHCEIQKLLGKVLFRKTYFLILSPTPRLVQFLLLYLVESSPLAPLCMHPGWAQIHDGGPPQVGTSRDSHVCCYKRNTTCVLHQVRVQKKCGNFSTFPNQSPKKDGEKIMQKIWSNSLKRAF